MNAVISEIIKTAILGLGMQIPEKILGLGMQIPEITGIRHADS